MAFENIADWRNLGSQSEILTVNTMYLRVAGGCVEGFILSELDYWYMPSRKDGKQRRGGIERDGFWWVVRTRQEWMDKLCLTKSEFDTGVKNLRAQGLVVTTSHFFGAKGETRKQLWMRPNDPVLLARLNEVLESKSQNQEKDDSKSEKQDIQGTKSQNQDIQTKSEKRDIQASKSEISEVKIRSYSSALTPEVAANAARADEPTDVDDKPDSVPPSKPRRTANKPPAKPKEIIIAPAVAARRRALFGAIVKAVLSVDADDQRAKPFVTAHRGRLNKMAETFDLAGVTADVFLADYGAGGRWFTLPVYYALHNRGKPTKRPTLDWIQDTFGCLENSLARGNGKGNGHTRASPADTEAELRAAEERTATRRAASPFLTTDQPPAWAILGEPS
jgi:hypothetical protein